MEENNKQQEEDLPLSELTEEDTDELTVVIKKESLLNSIVEKMIINLTESKKEALPEKTKFNKHQNNKT